MYKKTVFLISLVMSILLGTVTAQAACGVWRYKSDVRNVKVNSSLSGDDAPVIAIGWSRDHTSDLTFYMTLSGAEWNYGSSGTIQTGVTYKKTNKNTLEITVDVGTGEGEINFGNGRNIYVPIYCTVTSAGNINVIVDGNETTVSSATVTVAKGIDGRLVVSGGKAAINQSGALKKITIKDTSTQSYAANQRITLELDSGFHFTGDAKVTGTGKFENIVSFSADGSNKSKAYLVISQTTPEMTGEIVLEDTMVERASSSKFSALLMHVTFKGNAIPLDSNIAVASYKAEETDTTKAAATTQAATVTETTTETTTEATTAKAANTIEIKIGADGYKVNGNTYPLDVPAYISGGSTMLPLRALANAMGISDDNIAFDTETKTVTLTDGQRSVSITPGESEMYVSGYVTSAAAIDTPAEIKDGRVFLPVRAMANALGVDNSAISYNAEDKVVTIVK